MDNTAPSKINDRNADCAVSDVDSKAGDDRLPETQTAPAGAQASSERYEFQVDQRGKQRGALHSQKDNERAPDGASDIDVPPSTDQESTSDVLRSDEAAFAKPQDSKEQRMGSQQSFVNGIGGTRHDRSAAPMTVDTWAPNSSTVKKRKQRPTPGQDLGTTGNRDESCGTKKRPRLTDHTPTNIEIGGYRFWFLNPNPEVSRILMKEYRHELVQLSAKIQDLLQRSESLEGIRDTEVIMEEIE